MTEQQLNRAHIRASFQEMGGKTMAVLISILPMKGPQSPFIIIIIRFMANTAPLFAGYGATPVIKWSLSSVMKSRSPSQAGC
jgi:hypothetical protein